MYLCNVNILEKYVFHYYSLEYYSVYVCTYVCLHVCLHTYLILHVNVDPIHVIDHLFTLDMHSHECNAYFNHCEYKYDPCCLYAPVYCIPIH